MTLCCWILLESSGRLVREWGQGPIPSQTGKALSEHIPWFPCILKPWKIKRKLLDGTLKSYSGGFWEQECFVSPQAGDIIWGLPRCWYVGDRPKQAKDYSVVAKDILLAWTIFAPDHLSAFSSFCPPRFVFLSSQCGMLKGMHLVLQVEDSARARAWNQAACIPICLSIH